LVQVETVCPRNCPDSCFLTVTVEKGRIVSSRGDPDHPVTRGFTCPRGAADRERVYSEDRVLHPHVADGEKPGRGFRRVSWREALDLVSERLRGVLDASGAGRVLHLDYAGNTGLLTYPFFQRLWNALGATGHDSSLCSCSGHAALALHYGLSYGGHPEELPSMRAISFWGFNAAISSPHQWMLALIAREETGTTIAVVDPRMSETAKSADIWLRPRPGSDVALAFGVSRHLIEKGHVDREFIEEWTHGYQGFREEVLKWEPEVVEESTGVEWEKIEALAEVYGRNRPSATMIGLGLQKGLHGAESVRAVSLIPALLGQHRGFYYTNSRGRFLNFPYLTGEMASERNRKIVSQVALGGHLEAGDFEFVYVNGMNPAVTLPDLGAVRRGFSRDDVFLVVHDTHWTETARRADIVLPAPTYLEKEDIVVSDSHPYVRNSQRAIDPLGESRDEAWVMRALAERLGIEDWLSEDPWEAVEKASTGAFEDGTFLDLLEGRTLTLKSRSRDVYQTPTGKIEFASKVAEKEGLSPLPVQLPLPPPDGRYTLITSAVSQYLHTQFQEVYGPISPVVWVNTMDAGALDLVDGDAVGLRNELGVVRVRAVVTDRVPKGVLWSPRLLRGLEGEPQNILFPSSAQGIGGGPVFNSTRVKIEAGGPEK
jgi:anaerobic selenocysteine-containing dehydrogenase